MGASTLPNFLIVGAAKSGTTSLYHYLKQHPDVFMPEWKEPSFFVCSEVGGITDIEEYKDLFATSNEKIKGEASVAYLYDVDAPLNIKNTLGADTKIIILLRNPIDMAYSLWGHMTRLGCESEVFLDAFRLSEDRMKDYPDNRYQNEWLGNVLYRQRVQYSAQVKRYLENFDHVFIGYYEEFFQDTERSMEKVYNFLDVPMHSIKYEAHNKSGGVRNKKLQTFLRKPSNLKNFLKAFIPQGLRSKMVENAHRINRMDKPLPILSKEVRDELEKELFDDVRALESFTGKSLKEIWF